MSFRLSRRSFTAGLGASLLAAPFVQLVAPKTAKAATGTRARRLLVLFTPNGTIPRLWRPSGTETDFTFPAGSILEPLTSIKDDVIVLDQLDFYNADNHEPGMRAMLTNNGGLGTETNNRSIDQHVAQAIGRNSRFASLEFGVETSMWGGGGQTRMSYSGPNQFVTPDDNPVSMYTRLFGAVAGGSDGVAKLRARRMSVIDVARAELTDLQKRLGKAEQIKLDAHLTALRSVENGLVLPAESASCTVPAKPATMDFWANDNFPVITKTQIDMAALSLACGLTNVASVQVSHTVGDRVYSWIGVTDGHHTLSHCDDNATAGVAAFVKTERWNAEQFVYLINRLKALPDPEGGSLLDSTVVLWAKELGDSRLHVSKSVPWVMSGGGAFRNGRYLKLGGANHAKALTSISQAFGLTNNTFGDPAAGSGPLGVL